MKNVELFLIGIIFGFIIGVSVAGYVADKIEKQNLTKEHPIKYYDDGADTVQVIINNRGWEVVHPYKKKEKQDE